MRTNSGFVCADRNDQDKTDGRRTCRRRKNGFLLLIALSILFAGSIIVVGSDQDDINTLSAASPDDIGQTFSADGIYYKITSYGADGPKEVAVTGCSDRDALIIPATVINADTSTIFAVTSIDTRAFFNNSSLNNIDLGSVQTIGRFAFSSCTNLRSIDLGQVASIGDGAFIGCTKLTTIIVDDDNASFYVAGGVLFNHDGTELVLYPTGWTNTTYDMPQNVTSVGQCAFSNCSYLRSIDLSNITSIGDSAFFNCEGLDNVDISSVRTIDAGAFILCTGLKTLTMPIDVAVGANAFDACPNVSDITLTGSGDGPSFEEWSAYSNTPWYLSTAKDGVSVKISDGITSIGKNMFSSCAGLRSVTLPSSLKSIDNGAFSSCSSLETINLGSVQDIGGWSFSSCSNLTVIDMSSIQTIGECAFSNCTKLEHLEIDMIQSIGEYAFGSCSGLKTVEINEIQSIGKDAFMQCANLTSLKLDSIQSIDEYAFFNCPKLVEIDLGSVQNIGKQAFGASTSLVTVTVSDGNTHFSLMDGVLFNYDGTELIIYPSGWTDDSYSIPEDVISIGGSAFFYNPNLKMIDLGMIQYIEKFAFTGCTNLTTMNVSDGNTHFSVIDGVLFNYDGTELIIYPSGRTNAEYVMPDGVTSISDGAFGNFFLECIHLNAVETVQKHAFSDCRYLKIAILSENAVKENNSFPDTTVFLLLEDVTFVSKATMNKDRGIVVTFAYTLAGDPIVKDDDGNVLAISFVDVDKRMFTAVPDVISFSISTGTGWSVAAYDNMISDQIVNGITRVENGNAFVCILKAAPGEKLPSSIEVRVGSDILTKGTDYMYDQSTGIVTINADKITSSISITAAPNDDGFWTTTNIVIMAFAITLLVIAILSLLVFRKMQ